MYSLRPAEINHGSRQGLGGAIEQLNAIIERATARSWLIGGALVAAIAGASVLPLVGTAELVAGIVAAFAGIAGIGAAAWRRRLDVLPLEIAPVLARWEGPLGAQLTARAWMGRGKRLDRVRFEVRTESGALAVLAHDGPVIGPFQAVFEAVDQPVTVVVHAHDGESEVQVERHFDAADRIEGRFQPAFSVRKGQWRWRRERWSDVESGQ